MVLICFFASIVRSASFTKHSLPFEIMHKHSLQGVKELGILFWRDFDDSLLDGS